MGSSDAGGAAPGSADAGDAGSNNADAGASSASPSSSPSSSSAQNATGGTAANSGAAQQAAISEQDAKATALAHAGLAEGDVQFLFAHLDFDDGIQEWDIEFVAGNTEYDYTINAATGDIISFDNEVEFRGAPTQNVMNEQTARQQAIASGNYIAPEVAKETALTNANIAEADCRELGVELEYDSNPVHYDVDFTSGGMEYNYVIDAVSGEILYSSTEIDD